MAVTDVGFAWGLLLGFLFGFRLDSAWAFSESHVTPTLAKA